MTDKALQKLLQMKTHEEITLQCDKSEFDCWVIMRTYNGWIYTYHSQINPNVGHSVFVPMQVDVMTQEI